jgi:hypothetical protein
MTPFDPDTGMRVDVQGDPEEVRPSVAGPRWHPNPFLLALTGIWVVVGVTGLVAWSLAVGPAARSGGAPLLLLAAVCLVTAVAAGVAHLAVLAIGWRPPEE